ncbi:MAG: carbon starvation protein A [Planctomycetaceae bacterium]|nr:carbon starvation protein A [Planctomycetaceae bacterium]
MNLLFVVIPSAIFLTVAYLTYGRILARLLRLDPKVVTPAVELRDDVDYVPIEPKFLLGQHFSAIAAAGPIVGPILAGVMFGWAPALAWILIGSVFIGGVHDLTALAASIRHKARSIAEVVREHMSHRSYILFMTFVWLALVYIIVAFTDVTAASFVGIQQLENGQQITGGGIATSSLLYLILPMVMGVLLRYTKLSIGWATIIFLPLVAVSIGVGQYIPLDLTKLLALESDNDARKVWDAILLVYCVVASVIPMWLLLQPRGHLGGYFLYAVLFAGAAGLVFGGKTIEYPALIPEAINGPNGGLFPILFITIACGACSGFHSIIASGTTSKQLKLETDAKPVGYGSMLLEAMVAVVSLCCVMMLPRSSPLFSGSPSPNHLYALGIGSFTSVLGIPAAFGVSFGLMAFTTFVYDTLDVCTRLGRYILQELTGFQGNVARFVSTIVTAAVPLVFLIAQSNEGPPAWRVFWNLFGASNQLLAALTLLGVTVWLWRTTRSQSLLMITGLPCIWMYAMSMWALFISLKPLLKAFEPGGSLTSDPVPWVALVLALLGVLMLIDAILVLGKPRVSPPTAVAPVT